MLGFIWFVIKLCVIVALAWWFADQPGNVYLQWQGWEVRTSVGILLLGVASVVLIANIIWRMWGSISGAPEKVRAWRQRTRQQSGIKALTQGMVAIAAGEAGLANKQSRRANSLLCGAPLALVLDAQAAQLSGDVTRAGEIFQKMCNHPDTAFLGYRGLMKQALEAGEIVQALGLGEQAQALRPDAPWLVKELVELNLRAELYGDALRLQEKTVRGRLDDPLVARRKLAEILMLECHQLWQQKDYDQALRKSRDAVKADDQNLDAIMACGRLLAYSGANRKGQKLLMRAWERNPQIELVRALIDTLPGEFDATQKLEKMKKLLDAHQTQISAQLILAELALAAHDWDGARKQLDAALAQGDNPQTFRLMAQLEERNNGDLGLAHKWLQRAADSPAISG